MEKWFERTFDLSFGVDRYAAIYKQLAGAPEVLRQAVAGLPEEVLTMKPDGKWSIKEHAGHLSVLEPLWRIRFQDIREKKPTMTVADLNNQTTSAAGFNDYAILALVDRFAVERNATLSLLNSIDTLDVEHTSLHPRLKIPMRIIDLAYFVAEHDEHHFVAMRELGR
ncbi:DinB family protein [Puia dinghuensis]|uniref:DinB-like domain-containing protein n=1 Tax=Puia dinghuensis TaxID=1792502 RepID=A0A8J2UCV2_9BACT|nr:DinB family protein [Puia dinghuensis]GGA98343.1 hypothetical protein GCM10011511_22070 [Puia dinghuensis]